MTSSPVSESLAVAKVGDTVWIYHAQQNRYVDGLYDGRGVWSKAVIIAETRLSLQVKLYGKFDRKTGRERPHNGYTSGDYIAGQKERDDAAWRDAGYRISDFVRRLNDPEKLRQIAAIVGWALLSGHGGSEMTTMEQMVEAAARAIIDPRSDPSSAELTRMETALRAALPMLGEELGEAAWWASKSGLTHNQIAEEVRTRLSEIMEGK